MVRRVPASPYRRIAMASALACLGASGVAVAQDDVTIYRCTDASGKLTLQDKPCAKGQTQQTRQMQKLKDPPPRPLPAPVPALSGTAPAAPPPVNVVVVHTPQPLYECVRPDDSVYTSDDGEGDPRWVPAWDVYDGYSVIGGGGLQVVGNVATRGESRGGGNVGAVATARIGGDGGGSGAPQLHFRNSPSAPPPPSSPPSRPPPSGDGYGYGYGAAGSWVRDACHALPQREVCERLVDRRDEIRRRFFNAQPSERAVLSREERGINARLAADCGND